MALLLWLIIKCCSNATNKLLGDGYALDILADLRVCPQELSDAELLLARNR
jgi:hypothetical protein